MRPPGVPLKTASVLTAPTAAEPLRWTELPERPLRPDEIRVTVRAAGVNPVDHKMREGELLGVAQRVVGPSGPMVVGVDFAWEVAEVGPKVSDLKVGDRVVGGTDFSRQQRGSYAREVHVRRDQVAVLPASVDLVEAACLPVAGVTAYLCLYVQGRLDRTPEGKALVRGASGGVGHFAIQLARLRGGSAVGVCSARNVELVKRLGATPVDYGASDAAAQMANQGPYDVVVNAAGTTAYPIATMARLLKPAGTHVLVMPRPADYVHLALPGRVKTVLGQIRRPALEVLVAELAAGRLQVVIAERFPFDEAERAQQVSSTGRVAGKLVLVA